MSAAPGSVWDAEDWLAYFDERAAIMEHDGGISRPWAEHWAWQACRFEAFRQISENSVSAQNSPSRMQLVAILAGRIQAADAMLDHVLSRRGFAA